MEFPQQLLADDRSVYQRAKEAVARGDKTMVPMVQYYENGCKPLPKGGEYHRRARQIVVEELNGGTKQKDLAARYDMLYETMITRLKNQDFGRVNEDRCRDFIIAYEADHAN